MVTIEKLKKNNLLRYINNISFLNVKVYQGTSGVALISKNLETYLNIFNSYYYYEKKNIGEQKIILSDGIEDLTININLKKNESRIIKISDYYKKTNALKIISCRIFNNDMPYYVPYFYSIVVDKKDNSSITHSSSFGNALFNEKTESIIEGSFSKKLLKRSELILLTLFKYKKHIKNSINLSIIELHKKSSITFKIDFLGETCKINLKNFIKNLNDVDTYIIKIYGPATANPYLLIDSETMFHI
ncbi:hypothetical protein MCEHALHM7_00912 [Methylophilaceae bacterium]